jgi:Fe-S-cluster containining protein
VNRFDKRRREALGEVVPTTGNVPYVKPPPPDPYAMPKVAPEPDEQQPDYLLRVIDSFARWEMGNDHRSIQEHGREGGIRELGDTVFDRFERGVRVHLAMAPGAGAACEDGCHWCCFLQRTALVPEVLRIAQHLRARWDEARVSALIDRLERTLEQITGLDANDQAKLRVPCALLTDRRCSIYEVRPVSCGQTASTDAKACERNFGKVQLLSVIEPVHYTIGGGIQQGATRILAMARCKTQSVELNAGLHVALTVPDAEARWLAGDDVFEKARVVEDRRN